MVPNKVQTCFSRRRHLFVKVTIKNREQVGLKEDSKDFVNRAKFVANTIIPGRPAIQ